MKAYLFSVQRSLQKILTAAFLFLTVALYYAQLEKTYLSNQTNQVYGVCGLCAVDNSQNVVGNNENDYETLRVPIGLFASVEQTLIFPKLASGYRKVTMGIETPNVSIKEQSKREIYIETFNGNSSNNDYRRLDSSMLKPSPNPQKGTLEFTVIRPFDRIKLYIRSGLVSIGEELRIYYVHHLPTQFTTCGNPPLDPFAYYSFNGDTKDVISEKHFTSTVSPTFSNESICEKSLTNTTDNDEFTTVSLSPSLTGSTTFAFWVRTDEAATGESLVNIIHFTAIQFEITESMAAIYYKSPNDNIGIGTPHSPGKWTHYAVTFTYNPGGNDNLTLELFKNGNRVPGNAVIEGVPKVPTSIDLHISQNSQIDEFLVYNRKLLEDEILALAQSYNQPLNSISSTANKKIETKNEIFTVSPNPTTGQITLEGNILFLDADISITNTSGKEMYHSKFTSKTFELPSTLSGGVYILNLQTRDKKTYSRKIILNR